MSKSTRKLIQTCKLICTILLVALIGLQFIPYWYAEYTEKKSTLLSEEQYIIRQRELAEEAAKATEKKDEPTEAPTEVPTTDNSTDVTPEPEPEPEPEPAPTPTPDTNTLPDIVLDEPLGFGNYNENVGLVQQKLSALGYFIGGLGADNMFGVRTETAVAKFQADNGLVADGIVGAQTAAAIDAAYAKLENPVVPPIVDVEPENPENPETPENPENPETPEATDPTDAPVVKPSIQIQTFNPDMIEKDIPVLKKISIAEYTWMFRVNRVNENIFMPVLVLLFALAAIITYMKNTYSVACSIWGVLAPAVGLYGFLTVPLFSTGFPNAYTINVIAHAITLAVTFATLVIRIVVLIQTIKKDRAERRAKSSFADK